MERIWVVANLACETWTLGVVCEMPIIDASYHCGARFHFANIMRGTLDACRASHDLLADHPSRGGTGGKGINFRAA